MTHRQRKFDCLGLLALLIAPLSPAQGLPQPALQDVDSIRASAAAFVRERLQTPASAILHAEAGVLDSRLRLPACGQPPKAFSPTGELRAAARLTIGVRCDSPAWAVYVPVNIESELAVLVTTRAMPRNATVTAQDVQSQQRRVPGISTGYLTSLEELTGRHLRNAAAPGTALAADLLSPDVLIKRGQRVTLIASAGSIEVRAQGEAIADARPDGRIRVLNLASRRVVEGQVESRDSVRISL
jgi:flagellar basal body P-ring formation protein FlgA